MSAGPNCQPIGERFAAVASARRDTLAFRGPGTELTYRELNARANRLAHRLLACGALRDEPSAVLAARAVARFRELHDVRLTVRHLPENPTAATLSLSVGRLSRGADSGFSPLLQATDRCAFRASVAKSAFFSARLSVDD